MRKSLPKSEEFEIEDTVKEGSAEYYLKKAKYFFQTTEKLFKAEKITEDDFNHSKKATKKFKNYTMNTKKTKAKKAISYGPLQNTHLPFCIWKTVEEEKICCLGKIVF